MNSISRPRRLMLVIIVGAHFFLVGLGAARQWPYGPGWGLDLLDFYGTLSGASSAFNYFAPEITSELRARFEVVEPNGRAHTQSLFEGVSREAIVKVNSVIGHLSQSIESQSDRRSLTASWAKRVLRRNPSAVEVSVHVESLDLPSLPEYREGRRPKWEPYYRGRFARKVQAEAP